MVLSISIVIFVSYNSRLATISDNWWDIFVAKKLVSGDIDSFLHYKYSYGFVYPFFFFFKLLGFNPEIVSFLSVASGILSSLIIFSLAKLLFKNQGSSLFSAIILPSVPSMVFLTSLLKGKGVFGIFWLTSSLLFSLLYIKESEIHYLILSALLALFAAHVKPEYGIIIPILTLLYFLKRKELTEGFWKELSIATAISSPFILYYGLSTLKRLLGNFISSGFLMHANRKANYIIYFQKIISQFFEYWTSQKFWVFLPFLFIALTFILKKNRKEVFLLLSFLLINLPYLFYYPYNYEVRFAVISFPFFALLVGSGFEKALNLIDKKENYKLGASILAIVLVFAFQLPQVNQLGKITQERAYYKEQDYGGMSRIKNVAPEGSLIITPSFNIKWMLKSILPTYRIESFDHSDSIVDNRIYRLIYQEGEEEYNSSREYPITVPKENPKFLLATHKCKFPKHFRLICDYLKNEYDLTEVGKFKNATLYKFK